jgi:hypothetical protein
MVVEGKRQAAEQSQRRRIRPRAMRVCSHRGSPAGVSLTFFHVPPAWSAALSGGVYSASETEHAKSTRSRTESVDTVIRGSARFRFSTLLGLKSE